MHSLALFSVAGSFRSLFGLPPLLLGLLSEDLVLRGVLVVSEAALVVVGVLLVSVAARVTVGVLLVSMAPPVAVGVLLVGVAPPVAVGATTPVAARVAVGVPK